MPCEPRNEFGLAVTAAVIDRAAQGLDRVRQRDAVRSVGHDVRIDVSFELRHELVAEMPPRGGVLPPGEAVRTALPQEEREEVLGSYGNPDVAVFPPSSSPFRVPWSASFCPCN
jgi:hypothetical protein